MPRGHLSHDIINMGGTRLEGRFDSVFAVCCVPAYVACVGERMARSGNAEQAVYYVASPVSQKKWLNRPVPSSTTLKGCRAESDI